MILHEETADWFNNRDIAKSPPDNYYIMQAKNDWKLPDEAKYVMFRLALEFGDVSFYDGESETLAGTTETIVAKVVNGTLNFRCNVDSKFEKLVCIGYLK